MIVAINSCLVKEERYGIGSKKRGKGEKNQISKKQRKKMGRGRTKRTILTGKQKREEETESKIKTHQKRKQNP